MKFEFKKETNIKKGQKLFGIIEVSRYTYHGVYPVTVHSIDYNEEYVIFDVDQPCGYVSCSFRDMERYVFESREEAENMESNLEFGEGLCVWRIK